MTTVKPGRLRREIQEMADAQRRLGIMDDAAHQKITLRQFGTEPAYAPISAQDIRALRERAHLSQAVFARYLNLTAGFISQLERGTKRPTGPALALLNVIRRKGIDAIL